MMQYVRSDTLAELVWSPQTGLNIKFAEAKPKFMWESGPSDVECNMSENTQNEEHIASLASCHVSEKVASCTGSHSQGAADQLCDDLFEDGMTNRGDGSRYESRSPLKIEPLMQCRPYKHVEGSNGSMASCRSANFLTPRKRKCSFEQRLILGSKRIKNRDDGSSFMNWISNTLKGFKNHNVYDPRVRVCDGTSSIDQNKHFGFHNVFQSLFSPETIKQFERKSVGSLKETVFAKKCSHESLGYVRRINFYDRLTKEAPTEVFDTIRKLRLSRTDILKWMNSRSSFAHLDGFFVRLRVAKWEEEEGGSRYYVACITGSQGEDLKQSIRVKVGDVEILVQTQYISNCDFLEDELIPWWQKTSKNGGIPVLKDLKSKLAERRTFWACNS